MYFVLESLLGLQPKDFSRKEKKKKEILLRYDLNTDSDTLKKELSSVFSKPYSSIWQGTDFSSMLGEWAILLSGDIWSQKRRLTKN